MHEMHRMHGVRGQNVYWVEERTTMNAVAAGLLPEPAPEYRTPGQSKFKRLRIGRRPSSGSGWLDPLLEPCTRDCRIACPVVPIRRILSLQSRIVFRIDDSDGPGTLGS